MQSVFEEVIDLAASEEDTTATASAAAETEQTQTEATEQTAEEQEAAAAAEETKRSGGVQKRIDELTRKAKDTERENEALRRLLVTPPAKEETKLAPVVEKPAEKPTADKFETQEEFVEALTDWKIEQREKAAETTRKENALRTEQQTVQQKFVDKTETYKAAVEDFDDVIDAAAHVRISPALTNEVLTHDDGPALQYYLAKNPSEADRLNKLNPIALAKEIVRLEPRFVSAKEAPGGDPPAKVTKAPAPIIPVTRSTATSTKEPGDMSPAEYDAWHKKTYPNAR